jgi:hypothetical protein
MELVPFRIANWNGLASARFRFRITLSGEDLMSATTKIVPDRSKIAAEDPEELNYWSRHFHVTPEELKRVVDKVGNAATCVSKELKKAN